MQLQLSELECASLSLPCAIFRCILFSASLQICEFTACIEKLLHTHTLASADTHSFSCTHTHICTFIHTHTPAHTLKRNGSNLQWFMILINFLQVTLLFFLIMIYGHDAQSAQHRIKNMKIIHVNGTNALGTIARYSQAESLFSICWQ